MTASILVVDDESAVQDTLGVFLETEGYRVATVGSGEEALARIEEQEFDVIVADVVMPGLSGLEVLERSRELRPRAAVILMTGHATMEMVIEALRKGAGDCLQKPFVLRDLASCVQRLLPRPSWQEEATRPHHPGMPLDDDLATDVVGHPAAAFPTDLRVAVRLFAHHHVRDVLASTRYNKRAAARLLGISLASLYRKLNIESRDDKPE